MDARSVFDAATTPHASVPADKHLHVHVLKCRKWIQWDHPPALVTGRPRCVRRRLDEGSLRPRRPQRDHVHRLVEVRGRRTVGLYRGAAALGMFALPVLGESVFAHEWPDSCSPLRWRARHRGRAPPPVQPIFVAIWQAGWSVPKKHGVAGSMEKGVPGSIRTRGLPTGTRTQGLVQPRRKTVFAMLFKVLELST